MDKKCLCCGKEIFNPKHKFCSRSCATSIRNKNRKGYKRSEESKIKQSKSLQKFFKSEEGKIEKQKRKERAIIQSSIPKYQEIFKNAIKNSLLDKEKRKISKEKKLKSIQQKVKEGTWNTWKTRNIRSFPELFVENYFLKKGIRFETEKYISKNSLGINKKGGYFLDFYFQNYKLDLEIDGSQHKSRKEYDYIRDNLLSKNGYKVIRLDWVNIKNKRIKEEFLQKIDLIIDKIFEE